MALMLISVLMTKIFLAGLFNEELGAVFQIKGEHQESVETLFTEHGLADCLHYLGQSNTK